MKKMHEDSNKINKELICKLQQYGNKISFNIDKKDTHYSKFK